MPNEQRASRATYPQEGVALKEQQRSCCPSQDPAAPKAKQRAPSPPCPPLPFLPILRSTKVRSHKVANDPFPPATSPILPELEESGDGPQPPKETRRGMELQKIEKQSCDVDVNTAWRTMMRQIQQGVQLRPVSSGSHESRILASRFNHREKKCPLPMSSHV